uniref:Zn(2)-C6 fungal-type domain-containing protein n=1 Tax=Mycena chlorophos TaxID=658473 RepID=A0ABQ0M1A9_MYCCL|nr:predicted protein [Mycena chlorophos]
MDLGLGVPKRVAVACAHCRERKIKCITESKDKSCLRCQFNGIQCTYLATEKQRARAVVKARLGLVKSTAATRRRRAISSPVREIGKGKVPSSHRSLQPRPAPTPIRAEDSQPDPHSAPRSPAVLRPGFKIKPRPRDLLEAELDLDAGFAGPPPCVSTHLRTRIHPGSINTTSMQSCSHPSPTPSASSSSTGTYSESSASSSYSTPPSSAGANALSFDATFDPSFASPVSTPH